MNVGLVAETTTDRSLDSFNEFKEGVKLLKNDYPQKALAKLQSAFESDKHNPYYISFLGVSIARAQQKWAQASELCEMAIQLILRESSSISISQKSTHWQVCVRCPYIN